MEVLGSVVGTAIQGQIVGGATAPCIPTEYDLDHYGNESRPERNMTRSLDETVRPPEDWLRVSKNSIGSCFVKIKLSILDQLNAMLAVRR